ncbi:hypothetical protein D9M73_220290 [compost metagenome]
MRIAAVSTISTPNKVTSACVRLRVLSICSLKNGNGSDHSLSRNSTSNTRPPPSSQQINGELNQPMRSPRVRPITSAQIAGKPSNRPRQSNCLNRSRRSGS